MYLLKYITLCGLCSRRKAIELIKSGQILVDQKVIKEPGTVIAKDAVVSYQGVDLEPKKHVYVLLNKPEGYVTTCCDERGRKTVLDLIAHATKERVYPVGRLDRMTTGLLLFTNDGALAESLAHPRKKVLKVYKVLLDRPIRHEDLLVCRKGLRLRDGFIRPDSCSYKSLKQKREIFIQIHSGKNRIVRRIFQHLGYTVKKLDRIGYAGLTKSHLPVGRWRVLHANEIEGLKAL